MLQSAHLVLSGHTTISGFAFRPSNPSIKTTSSLGFYMEQSPPLKLKQCHQPHLACQATTQDDTVSLRNNESPVHGLSEVVVGVLGGGQLGRMMCQAASQMAIKVMVLDPQENCPASSLSYHHMVGSFDDSTTVEEFAKRCGVLTIEIEHVNVDTLEKLEKQGVDCQPKASTVRIIQDKYQQKVHFSQHGIPLPEFMKIDDLEGAKKVGELFGYPLMIKSRRLAYDGRGNFVVKSEEELPSAVDALGGFGRDLYAEKWAPFVKELAVIVARGRDNSISCYPVVETIHRDNICHIVKAPANLKWKTRELASEVALNAVNSLEGAGVFAVELFLTKDGQILLNEVAPRPHNSGHHTIESCYTSQYEQHLRAVVGLPLGDPSLKTPAAIMYNILGEEEGGLGFQLAHQLIKRALTIPGATVHWYDKPEMRKQRKMGHITIVGPSLSNIESNLAVLVEGKELDGKTAVAPHVGIIMGSDSDLPVMKSAAEILEMFGVPHEVRIVSAHRTPELMFSYASSAHERGIQVIIAGAGGAAHLPGMVAALTPLPVIGVPVRASTLDGIDSLLSIVQMPRGVPVATVAVNNATNAGLLAVRMLGVANDNLLSRMSQYQEAQKESVLGKGDKLEKHGWKSYLNNS
ncbi:Phosphoribosylaminoimidazole carboxylase, chloroplastic [Glycine soja]|uniref:phosphoribosylaminoimidazole carboxylase n=2 Tax=Glycine soja TaxID=3848 RepID=A0A0B2Q3Z8_GLYSO|nr:phosphoribosylaminoimidazole carboxylase, chloroplastic-like isoform X1 [Glycine soja]XP_028221931.1 phosphoribosylaminoimidazole carboxylase, chloroplastic-like isoform X1 [Glycine soja]XP_028221932.1 phosphoribosylaminoimidazole carboxylase, chloroplastic-like isoform X1 [Glycine soja]XP_028221933.1 phosphoribosylaminoimidazole carboxylase, chloroplastic-like isoform X1 [Glycine soja]XP_028221934.1 phosphoribosylaminoimidazole carboxylase, chloroplastic-like isoform X1 [Glycine soja]XP_02